MGVGVAQIVITAGAAAVSTYGQIAAARAQRQQARYNRRVAEQAAFDVRKAAAEKVNDARRKYSLLAGRQRAMVGGSGVSVDMGTAAYLTEDTAMMARLDVNRIMANAERQAWGLEVRGEQYGIAGDIAYSAGNLQAGGTLLSGAAATFSSYDVYANR